MKPPALLKLFIPVVQLNFNSPKPPPPDPSIEADRKKREAAAKQEEIAQAKTRATQAKRKGGTKKSLFSGGYRGFTGAISAQQDKDTLG
jgi:hypothetical protein